MKKIQIERMSYISAQCVDNDDHLSVKGDCIMIINRMVQKAVDIHYA